MEEKINICRPITFYNHFVPAIEKEETWEYCAFGVFDGVKVHDRIQCGRTDGILKGILSHQNEFTKNLKGKYMAQTVYAICYDDEKREREFWDKELGKNGMEIPFTFFCRMQLKNYLIPKHVCKEQLEKRLQENENVFGMLYTSYDNSDLIMVLKTYSYSAGAELINMLHQGFEVFTAGERKKCELQNSFTVFAVKKDFIAEMDEEKKLI